MPRIILVSGKGGVGKTTVSAATGLASSQRGHRTLVLSFDLAHSLSDSFDLDQALFSRAKGLPVPINERLDIQEIDVQEELERNWKDIYRHSASIMVGGGLDDVVAEEVAIMPGMEDVVALMELNRYVTSKKYDVIVLDCPPTSESLRFVSITTTLDWYARKRLNADRKLAQLIRPMAKIIGPAAQQYLQFLPEEGYFNALQTLFQRLEGVERLLRDPTITTVRLVTNPEKMVMRETQRAFMYFCMYGMTTDTVVINRMLPSGKGYFEAWAKSQKQNSSSIEDYFNPVPVSRIPFLSAEVVGLGQLEAFAKLLYADRDPATFFVSFPSYGFSKESEGAYRLEIKLPFVSKEQIDISRHDEDLVVRIGTFKRNILLPRSVTHLDVVSAKMNEGRLTVRFAKPHA